MITPVALPAGTDLADVQGLILRGYNLPHVRHVVLSVQTAQDARTFLGRLVEPSSGLPQITTANAWAEKPACTLNVGITCAGLRALGLPEDSLASFPAEFREGAAAEQRAAKVGDVGNSAPAEWLKPFDNDPGLVLLTLFGASPQAIAATVAVLRPAWESGFTEQVSLDGGGLPDRRVHFGYRDGISQPTITGAPPTGVVDCVPQAPLGEFLLGHPSQFADFTYPSPQPAELGRNGSFAAFRMLAQDVAAFEHLLDRAAQETGLDRELVAAKICGRWRNGTPLVLSPDSDSGASEGEINDFDYTGPNGDPQGERCPIGAHMRRMFPRGQQVAGGGGYQHRIVRRALPYGPRYNPARPDDGVERGLLGLFIGASLKDQFEFLMSTWAPNGLFTAGLGRASDPFLGTSSQGDRSFTIPTQAGPHVLRDLPQLITTRAGAYCFLPSVDGLRFLAQQF